MWTRVGWVEKRAAGFMPTNAGYPQPKDELVGGSCQLSVLSFTHRGDSAKELSAMLAELSKSLEKINEYQYAVTDN